MENRLPIPGVPYGSNSISIVENLIILGGSFTGQSVIGIGAGLAKSGGQSNFSTISIANGTFNLSSGIDSSCIGSSNAGAHSVSSVGLLEIRDGVFTLRGGGNAAELGSGSGSSIVEHIRISGGCFDLSGGEYGAGIEAGHAAIGVSQIQNL
jgi:hypothetical protein